MPADTASDSVALTHDAGLHARPSVKLTKLAKTFRSNIAVATAESGPWIDAKSIVKVMAAKAPKGTVLYFHAEGDDARSAIEALVDLVRSDFGEAAQGDDVHAGAA